MNATLSILLALALALAAPAAQSQDPEYASHGKPDASPTEVYLDYARAIHAADGPEAIFPYSPHPAAQVQESLEGMAPEQVEQALAFIRSLVPLHPEVLAETVDGDTATLEVRGDLPGMLDGEMSPHHGTVTLLRRGGEWKISNQSFEQDD